ncbi:MAG: hypothetical protein Q8Q96_01200 [bacterium]|nr:hypothetical protein [bacterium]
MKNHGDIFIANSNITASETAETIVPSNSNASLSSGTIIQEEEHNMRINIEKINIPLFGEINVKAGVQYHYKRKILKQVQYDNKK